MSQNGGIFDIEMSGNTISLVFRAARDLFSSCPLVLRPFKRVLKAVETTRVGVLKRTATPDFQTQRR